MKQLLTILLSVCAFLASSQIRFEPLQWKEALSRAKAENKIIFLNACTPWSEPCQLLEKYTLNDLETSNFFNSNFINVSLNMEEYPGIELAEEYGVDIYPSMLFIDSKGEVVHRGCGAMDAGEFLALGKTVRGEKNLRNYQTLFKEGNRDQEFLFEYLTLMEESCLDTEVLVSKLLKEKKPEELLDEGAFTIIEAYQWDIFSREFQYLKENKESFENALGRERVNDKIFNTYLAQYQEIYEAEELHLFGMRALLNEVRGTTFTGSDTLLVMMNLHYYEFIEDWPSYSDYAIEWVGMTGLSDQDELNDLAWKFYLFVEGAEKLKIATNWAKQIIDENPSPSAIDTYASLLFKQGSRKKAIELEKQAIEMARELLEETTHYEHQLAKFEEKRD